MLPAEPEVERKQKLNQNIAGRPLIIVSIHWLFCSKKKGQKLIKSFLCPQMRWGEKNGLVNQSGNEKPIDYVFHTPPSFMSPCWGTKREYLESS